MIDNLDDDDENDDYSDEIDTKKYATAEQEIETKESINSEVSLMGGSPAVITPQSLGQEEIPKWLSDADKAAKQSRKMKRRTKKLTDDWRFWLAIVGGVGLLSAAYSVYMQTGGGPIPTFIPPPSELII